MTGNHDGPPEGGSGGQQKQGADAFGHETLHGLFVYWDSVRDTRLLPAANEIDPSQIAPLLKHVTIYDLLSETDIRYRLVGTAAVERMGTDPTGQNLLDMSAPDSRADLSRILHTIVEHPVAAVAAYRNRYESGKQVIVRSLLLPLSAPAGASPRIIAIHVQEKSLTYAADQSPTTIVTQIDEIDWIDVGAGLPQGRQADG